MHYPGGLLDLMCSGFCRSRLIRLLPLVFILLLASAAEAQTRIVDSNTYHLRVSDDPEWDEFAGTSPKNELSITFPIGGTTEHTLSLVQYDVKQNWNLFINDKKAGSLMTDGNKMRVYYKLKPELIQAGENTLKIKSDATVSDDIVISEITIDNRPLEKVLSEATIDLRVLDKVSQQSIPSRITIVDRNNVLQSTGTKPMNTLAIRPGLVYTSTGNASLQLPAGKYIIYAGRGFEYGVDSASIEITKGQHINQNLFIHREVNTEGWVSSDTHIHTLTHSGHGDATDVERAVTIAGEGIELPVITEHNKIVDFKIAARKAGVDSFLTIITGDEYTTPVGHFNVFPFPVDAAPPNPRVNTWPEVSKQLSGTNAVVILNHGRDIHNRFRPFDPKRHVASAGMPLDEWKFPAHEMEVINSGALLNSPMQLVQDWFGLMNSGLSITPVGSSDSHDVGRYFLGQGRTYIKSDDQHVQKINIEEATHNFKEGKVMVSFGLLAKLIVNKNYGPGESALSSKSTFVDIEVVGPSWIKAKRISLYANGIKVREEKIVNENAAGTKWKGQWKLTKLKHDIFLVAVAEGDGPYLPFWPIVKPYQPVTTAWTPYTMGISGAVWVDADLDGSVSSANTYARTLVTPHSANIPALLKAMSKYDEAVSTQVAGLLHQSGVDLSAPMITSPLSKASQDVQEGFRKFTNDLKEALKAQKE